MNPVKIGSPVATVYRINSMLKIVCRNTATVVTQSSENPCRTKVAGPSRNSPLPIDKPRTMTPGPTTDIQPKPFGVGAAGSSARENGARPVADSGFCTGQRYHSVKGRVNGGERGASSEQRAVSRE